MAKSVGVKDVLNDLIRSYGVDVTVDTLIACRMAAYGDTNEEAALAVGSVVEDREAFLLSVKLLARTLNRDGSELAKALPF